MRTLAGRPCVDCHAFEFMQRALQDLRKTAYSLDSRVSPSSWEAAAWGWGPGPNLWHWPVFFLPSSGSSVQRGISSPLEGGCPLPQGQDLRRNRQSHSASPHRGQ